MVKQSSGLGQGDLNGQQFLTFGCYVTADGEEASIEPLTVRTLTGFQINSISVSGS